MFYILRKTGEIERSAASVPDEATPRKAGYIVVASDLSLPISNVQVLGFPRNPIVVEKESQLQPRIILNTGAKDTDGDGIPEIVADGKSQADIFALIQDANGVPLKQPIEVKFQVSAGRISKRKVIAKDGKARVKLTAGDETVMSVVSAAAEGFASGYLVFEFIPFEDSNT